MNVVESNNKIVVYYLLKKKETKKKIDWNLMTNTSQVSILRRRSSIPVCNNYPKRHAQEKSCRFVNEKVLM